MPAIKEKAPWLKSRGGTTYQDRASLHTDKSTEEKLNTVGGEEGRKPKLVTQLVPSLDLNITDLGLFASLRGRGCGKCFG